MHRSVGLILSDVDEWLVFHGTPLPYSCLENPMDEGPSQAVVHVVAKSRTTERLHFHFSLSCIGEGNGNPLQCSFSSSSYDMISSPFTSQLFSSFIWSLILLKCVVLILQLNNEFSLECVVDTALYQFLLKLGYKTLSF